MAWPTSIITNTTPGVDIYPPQANQAAGSVSAPPSGTASPDLPTWLSRTSSEIIAVETSLLTSTQYIYYSDDFIFQDFTSPNNCGLWSYGDSISWAASSAGHYGVFQVNKSQGWLILNGSSALLPGNLVKAVARFVVSPDSAPETSVNEWFCGFVDSPTSQQYGVLFSAAQGYTGLPNANGVSGNVTTTPGLLAGTYNSVTGGHYGYIQTGLVQTAGAWLDLIVVYTPTACRFYGAAEGTTPALIATITNNIPTSGANIYPIVSTASANTNLKIDRAEILFQVDTNIQRYMGSQLATL